MNRKILTDDHFVRGTTIDHHYVDAGSPARAIDHRSGLVLIDHDTTCFADGHLEGTDSLS